MQPCQCLSCWTALDNICGNARAARTVSDRVVGKIKQDNSHLYLIPTHSLSFRRSRTLHVYCIAPSDFHLLAISNCLALLQLNQMSLTPFASFAFAVALGTDHSVILDVEPVPRTCQIAVDCVQPVDGRQ